MSRHYSGVLVVAAPERLDACEKRLSDTLGLTVSHRDPCTGKMIAVLESESVEELQQALRSIQAEEDVLLAEPVNHYVEKSEA